MMMVYNKTKEKHWQHPQELFSPLLPMGWRSTWRNACSPSLSLISTAGVAHLRDKVKVDFGFPTPTDCKVSQQFLGMIILPPFSLRDSLDSPAAHCRPSRLSQGSHLAATHVHFICCRQGGPWPIRYQELSSPWPRMPPTPMPERSLSNRWASTGSLQVSTGKNSPKPW